MIALGIPGTLFPVAGCAQPQTAAPFRFTQIDLKLLEDSNAVDRQLENRGLIYSNPVLERHLADIAKPLLPKDPLEHVQWRLRILRDPLVNAFALPNGSIYVNSGLLVRAENDDQLAGVLAHEATHVSNRHSYLFNRSLRRKTVVLALINAAMQWVPVGGIWAATMHAAGSVSQVAVIFSVYGYSREFEREADLNGLERLRQSGRDSTQLVRVFTLLDRKLEPEPVPFFWRDHPKTQQRIAYLKDALGLKNEAPARMDPAYIDRMRPVFLQNIQMDLDGRCFRSAVAAAQRLVDAKPNDPEALFWLGESYRSLGPRNPDLNEMEITDSGQRKAYKNMIRQTEQEENTQLSQTPQGRAALEANQREAERLYNRSADIDPGLAQPRLGLGMLYEQQQNVQLALAAYRKYLELSPQAADRERVERRMAALNAKGASR
jgi:predicted Zn-dependent protease